jgi:hypothetical protein
VLRYLRREAGQLGHQRQREVPEVDGLERSSRIAIAQVARAFAAAIIVALASILVLTMILTIAVAVTVAVAVAVLAIVLVLISDSVRQYGCEDHPIRQLTYHSMFAPVSLRMSSAEKSGTVQSSPPCNPQAVVGSSRSMHIDPNLTRRYGFTVISKAGTIGFTVIYGFKVISNQ